MYTLNAKFFCAEARYTLVELGWTRQYPVVDLDLYLQRFYEKALGCYDPIEEEILVNIYLYGMVHKYRIFLENRSSHFPSWCRCLGGQMSLAKV